MWNAAIGMLRGKCIALKAHNRKEESSQINNLRFYLKKLEKRKIKIEGIIKITAKIKQKTCSSKN